MVLTPSPSPSPPPRTRSKAQSKFSTETETEPDTETETEQSNTKDYRDDPDYSPSTQDDDGSDVGEGDDSDGSDDGNDDDQDMPINPMMLKKLAPMMMGMPFMIVINKKPDGDDNSDDDEEDDEEDDEDEEDDDAGCGCCENPDGCEDKDEKLDEELKKVERRITRQSNKPGTKPSNKRKRGSTDYMAKILKDYNREERTYIDALPKDEKDRVLETEMRIRKLHSTTTKLPMRFKILNSPMDDGSKRIMLTKLEQFQKMHPGSSEYFKMRNWLNAVNRLPLGRFKQLPIHASTGTGSMDVEKVSEYLYGIRKSLDETVYGHKEAKEQVLRILAQWISNPGSCGHCIGIQGPPGCGKTQLSKDGICKALDLPFSLISLGCYGSDGSALTGHNYTYEGATYGKIAEAFIKAQYMNPILYFDELDKISNTPKGEEVANVLIHLTDSTQNDHFSDSYFSEIPLDISKCLIIFSYNDESLINPILKDRMITIHVSGYTKKEKLEIAQNYLIPRILTSYNLKPDDILFDKSIIEEIIERVPAEEGVRNLKRGIDAIIGWINMRRYVPNIAPSFSESERSKKEDAEAPVRIELPVKITTQLVKKYIKPSEQGVSKYLMSTMFT